ncbi:GMC oxidoreductase [Streptomyces sp. SAI-127]|uniref:GMC oxidoreductase n=1 Tax=Streptomyces sp. SAI-127 TaxID=2940543 RepID=UPI002475D345|nr:GMC oxidoreductase [Streptomyces sp. SAI-127]MDH6484158.1 cholesterol oxidase [Streptomyces sp. SAI-127]
MADASHDSQDTALVDTVVVGSGFGGAVTAYRLAEAGQSVVVLERGKPYPPGGFPRSPADMARNFWDPSNGLHGLFDIWSFRGLEGVVSSGLGGGSLIYANVLLRKDERWFVNESPLPGGGYENWPVGRADLDPHYDRVERMLGAATYPYQNTPKTLALHQAARRLDLPVFRPPLAVSFAPRPGAPPVPGAQITDPDYGNLHGLPRSTCRLCGECDIGCNYGSKNTLDHTYLSAARHHGADIRTRCEVRGFTPRPGGGYDVSYVVHDPAREGRRTATDRLPLHRIGCRRLVLAAGTFGSTYLLLRNRAALPGLSSALGTRFCGNGDLLGLVLHATAGADGSRPLKLDASRGPVITSAVRGGDALDEDGSSGRGFYIEDAGYPDFVAWLAESSRLPGGARRLLGFGLHRLLARLGVDPASRVGGQLALLLGPAVFSATSLPLLGMGRDVPDGRMRLRRGHLDVDWTTLTSRAYFERVRSTMRDIAGALGGDFLDNPLWWWGNRVITVHPLGGAPMGRHPGEGVCDDIGEVFGFPGLHVLDGALLPGAVGANPSLTIAAVADRACDRILEGKTAPRTAGRAPHAAGRAPAGRTAHQGPAAGGTAPRTPAEAAPSAPATPATHPGRGRSGTPAGSTGTPFGFTGAPADSAHTPPVEPPTSLSFTEEMKGHVALDVDDPEEGRALGRSLGQRLNFRLTITAADVDRFVAEPAHAADAAGHVDCDILGGRLEVEHGWFNLFTQDGDAGRRRMLYRLHLRTQEGTPLTLTGHKDVHDDPGADVWPDTSTLYVRLLAGHTHPDDDATAPVIGAGIVIIRIGDFLQQLTTFRTTGPHPARAMELFGKLFLGELWAVYGGRLARAVPGKDRP